MLTLVEAPAAVPISLAECKASLRLDAEDNTEDALIAGLIRAAVAQVDGRDGWLGRQLIAATWQLTLDEFPCGRISLPLPPLIAVTEVAYTDTEGNEQTLDPGEYQVVGAGGAAPGWVTWAHGSSWPAARATPAAVRVTYRAGYGASWNDVPEDLRHGLQLLVQAGYDNCHCEAAINLLFKYRAW